MRICTLRNVRSRVSAAFTLLAIVGTSLAVGATGGGVYQLGSPSRGAELVFGIRVRDTGCEFRMGPGSRNPDLQPHAMLDERSEGRAIVGFEDLYGGGDRDYGDNLFEFSGGVSTVQPKANYVRDERTPLKVVHLGDSGDTSRSSSRMVRPRAAPPTA